MSAASVVIVVPTVGRPSLALLLETLAAFAAPPPVVVVDDRPAPGGLALPAGLPGTVLASGGRGPAAARNLGWRAVSADWIAFLDDDVVPGPGWLDRLGDDLARLAGDVAGSQGRLRVPLPGDRRPTDWERDVAGLERARWATADMAYRRAALARVGGFDERFRHAYREDLDLALRVRRAGYRLVVGTRECVHPVGPADPWASVRRQRGNAADALLRALHGPGWREPGDPPGRRARHAAIAACAGVAVVGVAAGRRRLALAAAAGWLAGTAELAWARVVPGPRTPREVATMAATSAAVPVAAVGWWLVGAVGARRRGDRAPLAAAEEAWPEAPPLPRRAQVEVTGACNLRCPMCLVSHRPALGRSEGALPVETFEELLASLPELEEVVLQGLGEPLLSPGIFELLAAAKARGVAVGFNTNGTLLNRSRARRLVELGLDWLRISLDGSTPGAYEAIRRGARFADVATNVRGLLDERTAAGTGRPSVELVFVAMRRNLAELPGLVRLAHDWGVDGVFVQSLSHSFADTEPAVRYAGLRRFVQREALWDEPSPADAALLAEARALADELGVALRLPRVEERLPRADGPGCTWPWDSTYVTHRGEVQPCCMVMGEERATLGTLAEGGFAAVWGGEPARAFRRGLLDGQPHEVCRGCSLYRGVF
ncbi:MAG: radical SAM protein [Thermoleophilia bacterium]